MSDKKQVLFICRHNAGRSQMGEAVLNHRYGNRYEAYSAGINPSPEINPNTIEVLKESGIDISEKKPKSLDLFMEKTFDTVVFTCECEGKCPALPKSRVLIRKMFDDPSLFSGSKEEILKGFRGVLTDISEWIDENFAGEAEL